MLSRYEENEEDFRTALVDDAIDLCGAALECDEAVNERNYKDYPSPSA
jgi:hypothetical protein